MAISYDDYMKARSQKSTANNPKPSTNATSSSNSNQSSKLTYEDYMNRVNANKESGANGSFKWRNNTYIVDKTTGQTTKVNPFIKQKSKERKKKDEESLAKTGHESFITDIGEALSGGMESWGSSQLSTGATLGLAYNALRNKDNNYTPEFGSELWKLTHAASGGANYANKLMEGSKEGRGKVGQIVMDVGSQAVMNGIDAAIRSIPGIGQALGTASFMSRSFGGTAQQKRDEGKGIATQVVSGAVSAAIEQFTESASRISGIRNYTGADIGWLDGVNVKLESAIAKKFGPVIAKLSTSMLSEGLEEVASDILNPLVTSALEGAFKDSKLLGDFEAEEWQSIGDIAYDGLIGALSAMGGGMLEATGAVNTYRTKANGNNELYSRILREEYEADRAYAKDVARGARGLHLKSLFDAVDTLFNRETGESLTERASKAAGIFVSNKDAGKVLSQVDADYVRVVNEVAEKFAEQSFANEAVDKEVLKQGIINFFMNGDFSEDLNSIEGAKGQLKKLAQEIMKADAESRLAKAKSTKNKTKEAYYSSLLANLVNSSFAEESTNANVDDITEARTYGYTAEELAADQAAREAELHPEQERPAYVARQEQVQQAQQAQQQEGWVMRGDTNIYDPRNQAYIQKNNPELWAEYQNAKGMSGDAGVAAMRDVTAKMKTYLAEVNKDTNVSWQPESEPVAEQRTETPTEEATAVEAEQAEETEQKLTRNDKQKINRLFSEKQKSVKIGTDEHSNLVLETIRQRAEEKGVDIIVENGKVRLAVKGETNAEQEEQAVRSNEKESAEDTNASFKQIDEKLEKLQRSVDARRNVQGRERNASLNDADSAIKALKESSVLRCGDYTISLADEAGDSTAEIIDENVVPEADKAAYSSVQKMCGDYSSAVWLSGTYSIYIDGKKVTGNGFGVTIPLNNGKYLCIVNYDDIRVAIHEPAHALCNFLDDTKRRNVVANAVTSAITKERYNEIIAKLRDSSSVYSRMSVIDLNNEIFAFLANRQQWFTNEEVKAFYEALHNSDVEECKAFAQEGSNIIKSKYKEKFIPSFSFFDANVDEQSDTNEPSSVVKPTEFKNGYGRINVHSYRTDESGYRTRFSEASAKELEDAGYDVKEANEILDGYDSLRTNAGRHAADYPFANFIKYKAAGFDIYIPFSQHFIYIADSKGNLVAKQYVPSAVGTNNLDSKPLGPEYGSSTVGVALAKKLLDKGYSLRGAFDTFRYIGPVYAGQDSYSNNYLDKNSDLPSFISPFTWDEKYKYEIDYGIGKKKVYKWDAIKNAEADLNGTKNFETEEARIKAGKEIKNEAESKPQKEISEKKAANEKQNKEQGEVSKASPATRQTEADKNELDTIEATEESYDEIQNKKGTFRDDVAYAVTSGTQGTVSKEDLAPNIAKRKRSAFKLNGYNVYIAYSQGERNRLDDKGRANIQGQDSTEQTYTAEVYDKNKLVCRTSISGKLGGHEQAVDALADRLASAIGAYENGELKAVIPAPNGIGTKAQFKSALDKLIGWSKAGDYNSFKNGDSTSETFEVGNYNIELSSTIAEDGEPRRGDVYKYRITDSNGKFIDDGEWAMGSDYSPSWIIAEKIHNYAIDNGERMGVNDSVGKDGNVVTKTFNRVKTTGNTATSATAESQSETNRRMQEREERNQDYAERESAAMSDEEFWESRRADLDMPTLEEFTRGQTEQPKAEPKMSSAAANEIAERSFGKKGRVRATRVVENFKRLANAFASDTKGEHEGTSKLVEGQLGQMFNKLVDVNDGYGTVKDIADFYKTWRDNKTVSDYYDEDIAARFDKILEDAEAKGWTFEAQDQREFAQAYEEACNAMTAKINNVNKSADRLSRLKTEAIANKLNIKSNGLISKTIQRFIRMQITTDTAMKLFGGFKGSGEFYQLGKDIKDGVAKRMIKYVDAYSHFDNLKKMEGFKEFSQNTKKYQLEFNNEFNDKGVGLDNPLKGVDLSLQQIVTISRLIKTLDKTFEHSDAKAADRVKGFVIRDSNGNSKTIDLGLGDTTDTGEAVKASGKMTAIKLACDRILNQDGAVFEVARAYDKACDAMFKSMGKDVSAVKKALTGNALSLIGEDYTPVLWANDDGSPAEFNFNDDDRLRPPAFLYNRTAKQGNLVVSDISYIVDKYIEKAADYIGTAEIKDTLSRLNDGTSLLDKGKGLNSSLAENFGKDAGTWFDEYVKDLTQYGENDSIWSALRKNMQKGALIGSPSVMMKQTSSYWSAMGLLSPEALAMAYRWKVGVKAADNSEYNKLLKYRHISDNIDPTLTEIIKGMDKYGKASNSRVFQLFTNGISEQDFKTVDNLYTATMIDTYLKNQNKGAEYFTSGEFQNDIDSKFTEVMMRSQPMFDTELRAEYARTDNELVKMTSMFRTQQTQNLNLIATAIGEYNASKGTGEQGEKLKVLQQTVAGQASAALSLALLSVAADFMLHGLKKYRGDGDDDDEEPGDGKIELGRILRRIGLNTVETGAGTVWFGDSVAKWLIDRMSGGETSEFYGLNMGPITTFKNILDNLEYAAKSPTPSNIKNVATNISQLMGIPLNNAYRIVNSAVMYVEDVAGVNDKNYDDMLKKVTNRTKVNEKNVAGRNLLVESGMTKREATAFVKTVDVDDNGLNKEDLQNYYIEHPEDAERVSILWDSMGWKTKFEKEQKSLDKKVVYNSNPLYAEMDEDESGSVTKTEMMDYALEHEDQIDELSALYKEQDFKGSFRSALKSAENSKLKEQAEDAFYEGDYNVLFDTVSQMKNGKTYLTNLIKDEYDEYDNVSNPLVRYMIDAKRPVKEIDEAVEAYGAKKFIPQYKALRSAGLAPKAAIQKLDNFDANANGSITQQELADYYKAHKDEEAMIAEFWKACGWSTTWSKYKKRKKLK